MNLITAPSVTAPVGSELAVHELVVRGTSTDFTFVPSFTIKNVVGIELLEVLIKGYPVSSSIPDDSFLSVWIRQFRTNLVGAGVVRTSNLILPLKDTVTHTVYHDRLIWESRSSPIDLPQLDVEVRDSTGATPATLTDLVLVFRVYARPFF